MLHLYLGLQSQSNSHPVAFIQPSHPCWTCHSTGILSPSSPSTFPFAIWLLPPPHPSFCLREPQLCRAKNNHSISPPPMQHACFVPELACKHLCVSIDSLGRLERMRSCSMARFGFFVSVFISPRQSGLHQSIPPQMSFFGTAAHRENVCGCRTSGIARTSGTWGA